MPHRNELSKCLFLWCVSCNGVCVSIIISLLDFAASITWPDSLAGKWTTHISGSESFITSSEEFYWTVTQIHRPGVTKFYMMLCLYVFSKRKQISMHTSPKGERINSTVVPSARKTHKKCKLIYNGWICLFTRKRSCIIKRLIGGKTN